MRRAPSVDALKAAGAERLATTLREAVKLRDECSAAGAAVTEARQQVRAAEGRDRLAHAEQVKRDVRARLEPRHAAKAKAELERAERRHAALVTAVEQSADALYGTATDEAAGVIEAARRTRERAAAEIAEATEKITRALDDADDALSLAGWASEPSNRRWQVALRTMELGRPRLRLDRAMGALAELPAALSAQRLPGEEEDEDTRVYWGWSGLGRQTAPPGSQGAA